LGAELGYDVMPVDGGPESWRGCSLQDC
jgi:hypothetical protein